jgi:putative PIN family toxin of toxin-antitoxin system
VRIALDSTILVRAHQKATGPARALLLELLQAGHRLILSATILEELERVLYYPRLQQRSNLTPHEITEYLAFLVASAQIVQVDEAVAPPIRDSKDVHVLQTALAGSAQYLCTLDRHFYEHPVVAFCSDRGLSIISDVELLALIRATFSSLAQE